MDYSGESWNQITIRGLLISWDSYHQAIEINDNKFLVKENPEIGSFLIFFCLTMTLFNQEQYVDYTFQSKNFHSP
jgi:hypothetical protein